MGTGKSSTMKRINFLFGIHNHQPIGNFDFVFQEAYEKAYLPFLSVLEKFPSIKLAVHFSGILLDWTEKNHPDLIYKIKKMVERGQLEVMTGAYYEPILSIIPEEDRIGQIKMLSKKIRKIFGYDPIGLWLAERVWEPTLPTSLKKAGVKYTVTDDTHFKYAGLSDDQLNGYYITEDLGNSTMLYPISKKLRYTIPFEDPQVTIEYLRSLATEDGQNLIVFADDGEKFGAWPNTYDHVYSEKWLERFFQALEKNSSWINMIHFKEAPHLVQPIGKIYLPAASYAEMMQWALFPESFQAYENFEKFLKTKDFYEEVEIFVRGGFWRNFLAKYPEVNDMHKKMLRVSEKLWNLPEVKRRKARQGFTSLWAGQCNCPYWHGVFGGVYLSHLRDAIYQNLIRAEAIADEAAGKRFPSIELKDINVDGSQEIIVESTLYNAYLSPHRGGMMYGLDYKPLEKNLLDTMTRRKEGYHEKLKEAVVMGSDPGTGQSASIHDLVLAKEPDLLSHLHYDFYERKSYIDHFIKRNTTLKSFASSQYVENGDFLNNPYDLIKKTQSKEKVTLVFQRIGTVSHRDDPKPVKLVKKFILYNQESKIVSEYTLSNETGYPIDLWFGIELNYGLQAGHAEDRFYYSRNGVLKEKYLNSTGILKDSKMIGMKDLWRQLDIRIEFDQESDIWRFPVETISLSEGGFEKVYQSSVVFPNWKITLDKKWRVSIKQNISVITD
jgi:alpha-amylase